MKNDDQDEKRGRGRPGFDDPVRIPILAERADRDEIDMAAASAGMSRSAFMVHHALAAARRRAKKASG